MIKFCERPENKHLVKPLVLQINVFLESTCIRVRRWACCASYLRRDKYNSKLKKYYVEVDEEMEDIEKEEERRKHEEIGDVRHPHPYMLALIADYETPSHF